jgi:hypothetical protein
LTENGANVYIIANQGFGRYVLKDTQRFLWRSN